MTATTPTLTRSVADTGGRRGSPARWTAGAGAAYVASWVAGLATAPPAPGPGASAEALAAFSADHGPAVLLSSSLVHGAAGLALVAFATALAAATRVSGGLRRAVVGTGAAAALLSLTQVVLAALAVTGADRNPATTSQALFEAVDLVDVVKIAFLAAFVAVASTATSRARLGARWLHVLGAALVPVLLVGSAAMVTGGSALTGVLAASLLGLLVWAGGTALHVGLRAR